MSLLMPFGGIGGGIATGGGASGGLLLNGLYEASGNSIEPLTVGRKYLALMTGKRDGVPLLGVLPGMCEEPASGDKFGALMLGTRSGVPVIGAGIRPCGADETLETGKRYLALMQGVRGGVPILVAPCVKCGRKKCCVCPTGSPTIPPGGITIQVTSAAIPGGVYTYSLTAHDLAVFYGGTPPIYCYPLPGTSPTEYLVSYTADGTYRRGEGVTNASLGCNSMDGVRFWVWIFVAPGHYIGGNFLPDSVFSCNPLSLHYTGHVISYPNLALGILPDNVIGTTGSGVGSTYDILITGP